MDTQAITPTNLRIIIAVIGVLVLALIFLFGRPRKPAQGRRTVQPDRSDGRVDPVIGETSAADVDAAPASPQQGELDVAFERELDQLGATVAASRPGNASPIGRRPVDAPVDRIVSLFVVAREGETFRGSDIAVAAEKAGLQFGAMGIFHRLVDGRPAAGPIFSMANMVKPGHFDMARIGELETPGVTFFVMLPGPLAALDAWDALLPAAQRIAELLDGELLDEDHNALGRQRIAGLREELRAWDRHHEGPIIAAPPPRR